MRNGDPIPTTTLTNAHPPLLMAYLALAWSVFGFHPEVTRLAMLLVASLALLAVFRLAWRWTTPAVAVAATALTAMYPVFFAQASLAHLDLPAAALTLWGLLFYLEHRRAAAVAMFSLAVLAKATALITPLALLALELLFRWRTAAPFIPPDRHPERTGVPGKPAFGLPGWESEGSAVARNSKLATRNFLLLLLPILPLAAWFLYHYLRTGYLFGNPEFVRYNLAETLHPLRILLAALMRLWHAFGHMNMLWLTAAMLAAMFFPPLRDRVAQPPSAVQERSRIPIPVQAVFAAVAAAYIALHSVIGGAVLARYLLPVFPLVILVAVSTLRRRVRHWPIAAAAVGLGFVVALLVDPPYRFPPEENLSYRHAVALSQRAASHIEQHHAGQTVLTAWPMSDYLRHPGLGYVSRPLPVAQLEDLSTPSILAAAQGDVPFGVAVLFSTQPGPEQSPLDRFAWWRRAHERFFDDRPGLPPQLAAQFLGGSIVLHEHRGRHWIAVITIDRDELAFSR